MPVETFEIIKLILGVIILTIPGFLWSFIFSKKITFFERIIFGFMSGLGFLTCMILLLNVFLKIEITQTLFYVLYIIFSIPIFIIYGLSVYKFGIPKIKFKPINMKYVLLIFILVFVVFMTFLPHISNNYYLPFHVDEWIHWSYTRSVIESGQSSFQNSYTGSGIVANPEIGFHIATANIKWISGSSLLTIFLYMPAIIGVFLSLIVFNIGERSKRKFGLEAAFLIAFIPTTCRFMGPSFYVAVTMGLLILIFVIWLAQLKEIQSALLISAFMFFMFIVHPVTALAGSIILLFYTGFLVIDKKYKIAFFTCLFSVIPILVIYYLSTRWSNYMELFISSLEGKEYIANLPPIWVTFQYLGGITWALFVIGVYFCFTRGGSLKRTLSVSAISFIILIGLYYEYTFGLPIIYDRMFLYLFILVCIVAGIGLAELRRSIFDLINKINFHKYMKTLKKIPIITCVVLCLIIVFIAYPVHKDIGYYQMIDETDYETFVWIDENIDSFRDKNHSILVGGVHPFKASPFSAVTGLYIVSSIMHPIYGISLAGEMFIFLNDKCVDTGFIERFNIGLVYGECKNDNLTRVYPNVYIYPALD